LYDAGEPSNSLSHLPRTRQSSQPGSSPAVRRRVSGASPNCTFVPQTADMSPREVASNLLHLLERPPRQLESIAPRRAAVSWRNRSHLSLPRKYMRKAAAPDPPFSSLESRLRIARCLSIVPLPAQLVVQDCQAGKYTPKCAKAGGVFAHGLSGFSPKSLSFKSCLPKGAAEHCPCANGKLPPPAEATALPESPPVAKTVRPNPKVEATLSRHRHPPAKVAPLHHPLVARRRGARREATAISMRQALRSHVK